MANKLKNYDISFPIDIVYNKAAFQKTLKSFEKSDMLSKAQMESILQANEFMRQKTYTLMCNRHIDFKLEYIQQFIKIIISSN